jgi:hypothetical protein
MGDQSRSPGQNGFWVFGFVVAGGGLLEITSIGFRSLPSTQQEEGM